MNSIPHPINQQPARSAAVALLEREKLPASDMTDQHLKRFTYAGAADTPTGMVGLEVYGTIALLRSLVVSADARSAGLATALIAQAEDYASSHGVHLFLSADDDSGGLLRPSRLPPYRLCRRPTRRSDRLESLQGYALQAQRSCSNDSGFTKGDP